MDKGLHEIDSIRKLTRAEADEPTYAQLHLGSAITHALLGLTEATRENAQTLKEIKRELCGQKEATLLAAGYFPEPADDEYNQAARRLRVAAGEIMIALQEHRGQHPQSETAAWTRWMSEPLVQAYRALAQAVVFYDQVVPESGTD